LTEGPAQGKPHKPGRKTGSESEIPSNARRSHRPRRVGPKRVSKQGPALAQALGSSGPALVDVVTDPNVLAMPPKATVQEAKGFALAMTKMAFTGELEDVPDTVLANWRELV
jgi:hypothetical protein